MKHLKKFNNKYKYYTKEELDKLTYSEFEDCRRDFLYNSPNPLSTDDRQYINELELYSNVRFKDVFYSRFDRYAKDVEDKKEDEWTTSAKKLLSSIPTDALYSLTLKANLRDVGDLKFIKGIDITNL